MINLNRPAINEGWAVSNKYGEIFLWSVGRTRKEAMYEFCREGRAQAPTIAETRPAWKEHKKCGHRAVKIAMMQINQWHHKEREQ